MIDYHTVTHEVGQIIAERPDFVYRSTPMEGCVYFRGDQPSCVVGHWLSRRDVPSVAESDNHTRVSHWIESYLDDEPLTNKAVMFLCRLQRFQDTGMSWGNAYTHAVAKTDDEEERELA
jgi:hypothetical protein